MSEELLNDAIRELEKDELLLEKVSEMLEAEAQMNAAKHMAERVLPNPLAVAVLNRLGNLNTAINHLKLRQERLFQPEDNPPPLLHSAGRAAQAIRELTEKKWSEPSKLQYGEGTPGE